MQTLADFKTMHNISTINLYESNTGSGRLVGNVVTTKGERTIITKPPFSQEQPIYVREVEVETTDAETGEITKTPVIVLSNNAGKAPKMSL